MPIEPIRIAARAIPVHKAVVKPQFKTRNVLTNSPWTFVDLWLRREKSDKALLYWEQSRAFYDASRNLPMQSAPLLLYYSYMNAAKALLAAKSIVFDEHHGVRAHNMRRPTSKISLSNEGVRLLPKGITPAVSAYFGEVEQDKIHSLEDILYNLVFVHRTYCLTFRSQGDIYFPLYDVRYVRNSDTNHVYLSAKLSKDVPWKAIARKLPASLTADPTGGEKALRSQSHVNWILPDNPTDVELSQLTNLHRQIRQDLHYINAAQTLWYVKTTGVRRLQRQPLTLILMAMHRLSEICRYRPGELKAYLNGQKNWLLAEFITMSPDQFIDEISSELTGNQFLRPNVRVAS